MSLKEKIDLTRLPEHIAIIMDGNGRWAKRNGKDRFWGHQEGVVSLHEVVEAAGKIGVRYLTAYTFSTENWNRPQAEVDALMELVVTAIRQEIPGLMEQNVRLLAIGDLSRLPDITKETLIDCIHYTSNNTGISLIIALNYSSRWEITQASKIIAGKVKDGLLYPEQIDERCIAGHLTTYDIPDPDLLIRTGGEYRISNFLMWQLSYSELYFTDVYWPDFRGEQLYEAILAYQSRERRFGKTGEQIQFDNNSYTDNIYYA